MLQHQRIDVSDRIVIDTSNKSKECMILNYWYFEDIGYKFGYKFRYKFDYKFEPHVCNKCHDISVMAYELENIAIRNIKGIDYISVLWNITRNDATNRLNNSELDGSGTL